MTNLAWRWLRHPGALEQIGRLVIMGGAVNAPGNVTPHAEFNFYSDPEAAALVLSSGVPLTLVDLAVCRRVGIDRQKLDRLEAKSRLGRLAIELLANWFRRQADREWFEFYDPLALAVALEPDLVSTYQASIKVEAADSARLGETLVTGLGGPIAVAQRVDSDGFFTLMQDTLGISTNK